MSKNLAAAVLLPIALLSGCCTTSRTLKTGFSHFVGIDDFSNFSRSQNKGGQTVLLSPEIKSGIPWNELIVSWNADAPAGTFLKVEASAAFAGGSAQFYDLGDWSPDNR